MSNEQQPFGTESSQSGTMQPTVGTKGKGLGIAAMILGIVAALMSFLPLINILGIPLAIVGLILGIVAIVMARGKQGPIGFGIAGVVLSAIALIITIAMYGAAAAYVADNPDVIDDAVDAAVSSALAEADSQSASSTSETSAASAAAAEPAPAFDEATNTFTAEEETITIDQAVLGEDYDGAPMVSIYFTVTNNGDEDTSVQMLYLDAVKGVYQDNGNTRNNLDMALVLNSDEEDHLQDNLKPGGTISGIYRYSLEDASLPIEIDFISTMFGDVEHTLVITL